LMIINDLLERRTPFRWLEIRVFLFKNHLKNPTKFLK
jgi:hypothetical protein